MQEIKVTSDVSTRINIVNIERARDIPAGASIELASLVNGSVVEQANPLSAPSNGVRKVCKQAKILTGSTTTVFKVETMYNQFKVGEFVGRIVGGLAYAITDITDNGDGTTDITVETALEDATVGQHIYQMAAESGTTTSALLNTPVCILGKSFQVDQTKVMEDRPAYIAASVIEGSIGSVYLSELKNIDSVSY